MDGWQRSVDEGRQRHRELEAPDHGAVRAGHHDESVVRRDPELGPHIRPFGHVRPHEIEARRAADDDLVRPEHAVLEEQVAFPTPEHIGAARQPKARWTTGMDVAVVRAVQDPVLHGGDGDALGLGRDEPLLAVVLIGEEETGRPQTTQEPPDPRHGPALARHQLAGLSGDMGGQERPEVDTGDHHRDACGGDPLGRRFVRGRGGRIRAVPVIPGAAEDGDREHALAVISRQSRPRLVVVDLRPEVQLDRVERSASEDVDDRPEKGVHLARAVAGLDALASVLQDDEQPLPWIGGETRQPLVDASKSVRPVDAAQVGRAGSTHDRPKAPDGA